MDLTVVINPMFIPLIGVTIALTALIKGLVAQQYEKWMPLVALLIGVGLAFLSSDHTLPVTAVIYAGLLVGLAASGTWSGAKSLASKPQAGG